MAIKVQGTTVIDDSRDIANVGFATVGILSVGTYIYDANGTTGSNGQALTNVTGFGVSWADQTGGGGGDITGDGSDFNTGITSTTYASASNDIDGFTGIAYSFPATAGKKYVIESIHVSNVYFQDLYFSGRIDFNSGENVPLANKIIVPEQGSFELMEESIIANPSDNIRFGAFSGIGSTATGVSNGLDCFITYSEKSDTDYIGLGTVIDSTFTDQTVFTSSSFPSVVNTITLVNNSDIADIDASVSIFTNGTIRKGYLVYNLTIPQNSSVQILPRAKHLNTSDTLTVKSSSLELGVIVAGKYIN
jgi:hypothetical protein